MTAVFHDGIFADDTEVAHAVFDVSDDIGSFGQNDFDLAVSNGKNQSSAFFAHLRAIKADLL